MTHITSSLFRILNIKFPLRGIGGSLFRVFVGSGLPLFRNVPSLFWGGLGWGLLLLSSCVDMNDATQPISARIQLVQPTECIQPADLSSRTVTLLSANGESRQSLTDAQGVATFSDVVPDVYDVSTSWTVTGQQYNEMTGTQEVIRSATISGSLNSKLIVSQDIISVNTNISVDRDIVIGKVYYAASKDNNNRTYMAGKYIELYNQSNDTIDVSGLYVGMTEAESTPAYTLDNLRTAFGGTVILLKQIYRIPTDLPKQTGRGGCLVAPGGTVVICNSAIDHTVNSSLEHNLVDADFEVKDVKGSFQNNPDTPAMEMIYQIYNGTSVMNILQSGPAGVVIFRTDDDVTAWQKVYAYGKTTGMQWVTCPVNVIIDGMEALRNGTSGIDVKTKRLFDNIDAGYTYINAASGWNGETVYRKTLSTTPEGRKILLDTNNSSNDFKVSTTIQPREYDE